MNERLDLTKILKDCLKGTKLYSTIFGEVEFIRIDDNSIDYPIDFNTHDGFTLSLTSDGRYNKAYQGECTLFPSKDQRDWSKWHIPFKDGDVLTTELGSIFILKEPNKNDFYYSCYIALHDKLRIAEGITQLCAKKGCRLATEEEKQKLFNAIKANGYKWDFKTKTLEKLVLPKFKVGDRIKQRLTGDVYKVVFILSNECGGGIYNVLTTNEIGKIIYIEEQDNYELLPNKLDPDFFKPFDKVLCRMNNNDIWGISLFERYAPTNPYPFFCIQDCFSQCVPYNDNTKHLVGTNNEAPEFYRYWED